ncbi:RING-type domain-containing protein [Citrus sinensis]|nr:RING-type domain-containing protein [Citrus sinensis]
MESSSLRKSSYHMKREKREREKFVSRVISPAIRWQKCPICLDNLTVRRTAVLKVYFLQQQLQPLIKDKTFISQSHSSPRTPHRIIRRSRDEISSDRGRSRPLPWRRSFGRPGSVPDEVVSERKLRWRASVYNAGFQAVPLSPRMCLGQNASGNNFVKGRLVQRIDPWIRRELQALLGDPDPSIIVHVASTLFIASLEGKLNAAPRQPSVEDDFLAPLRPFLLNQTDMFWHELSQRYQLLHNLPMRGKMCILLSGFSSFSFPWGYSLSCLAACSLEDKPKSDGAMMFHLRSKIQIRRGGASQTSYYHRR